MQKIRKKHKQNTRDCKVAGDIRQDNQTFIIIIINSTKIFLRDDCQNKVKIYRTINTVEPMKF